MHAVKEIVNDALGRHQEEAPGTTHPHQDEKLPEELAAEHQEYEEKHHRPHVPSHPPGDYNRPL